MVQPPASPLPPDEFAPWEVELAHRTVRRAQARDAALRREDAQDVMQECLLHWWDRRRQYLPNRGASPETFMRTVLERKLIDLAESLRAEKRGEGREPLSLDAPASDDPDAGALGDRLKALETTEREALLNIAIGRANARLTPRQRRLVRELYVGRNVAEISRLLGVARTTLNDDRTRIAEVFRDEGLHEFLR